MDNRLMQMAGPQGPGGYDPNNAATIPEWMLQVLNQGQGAGAYFNRMGNALIRAQQGADTQVTDQRHGQPLSGYGMQKAVEDQHEPMAFWDNNADLYQRALAASMQGHGQMNPMLATVMANRQQHGQSLPGGSLDTATSNLHTRNVFFEPIMDPAQVGRSLLGQ